MCGDKSSAPLSTLGSHQDASYQRRLQYIVIADATKMSLNIVDVKLEEVDDFWRRGHCKSSVCRE